MKAFVHIVVIIAMVTLGISPACAFINGSKNWIEICSADGDIKRIQVSGVETPFPDPGTDHQQDQAQNDCGFCFSYANGKAIKAIALEMPHKYSASYIAISAGQAAPRTAMRHAFQPRGPPSFS